MHLSHAYSSLMHLISGRKGLNYHLYRCIFFVAFFCTSKYYPNFSNMKSFLVKKGSAFTTVLRKPEVDLTADMINRCIELWSLIFFYKQQCNLL